jgi:hypothetical protein
LWTAIDENGKGDRAKLIDSAACPRYVETTRRLLDQRLNSEKGSQR